MSNTPKIGYVASGPILSNGPQSAHQLAGGGGGGGGGGGAIVSQNCMLAGIVNILLNRKVYFANVYARMSLNRSLSDTNFKLMWDTKKE